MRTPEGRTTSEKHAGHAADKHVSILTRYIYGTTLQPTASQEVMFAQAQEPDVEAREAGRAVLETKVQSSVAETGGLR